MSDSNEMKLPCEVCHRVKKIINHCEKHDTYTCDYCKCFDCLDIPNQVFFLERLVDRKQIELSMLYVELNQLRRQIN